ncbi:MAG: type II secretion system minor pseudopilin GspJ [Gammaproteobacteria bacterium]
MRKARQGFTLIELVVALAIFAVVSALVYGGLRSVLDTRNRVEEQAARLAGLQTAFVLMARDAEQATARRIRDDAGGPQPAMRGATSNGNGALEFTRTGWNNPAGRARSTLQRAGYLVRDGKLLRVAWTMLDRGPGDRPQETVLLDKVKGFEMRFLDPQMKWQLQWPLATTDNSSQVMLPRAIEVSVDVEGWGRIPRLFRVPGAIAAAPAAPAGVVR